jgi:hypothetical protein
MSYLSSKYSLEVPTFCFYAGLIFSEQEDEEEEEWEEKSSRIMAISC